MMLQDIFGAPNGQQNVSLRSKSSPILAAADGTVLQSFVNSGPAWWENTEIV
jgi:hypothetical protein